MVLLMATIAAPFALFWWLRGSFLGAVFVWFFLVLVAGEVHAGDNGPPLLRWACFALVAAAPFGVHHLAAEDRADRIANADRRLQQ